ncbi:MAG: hypothetical protein QOK40_272, partial [Miltoncostaeaceae bacterium]|nr:hypothetical protein [Miltoncostaeaceae bacterium]
MSLAASRPVGRTLTAVVVGLIAAALPATALGQATRTWVSGVGDDANPCSRTAPCKTFAGAISKTAAKGEINVLDPGGFGGVTITKSLTINGRGSLAGVLTSGTNAIVVNALSTDSVVLRGLDINGLGTSLQAIRVLSAKSVKVEDVEIYGFTRNAVDFESTTPGAKLLVTDSYIHDNTGNAVVVAPANSGTGAKATVSRTVMQDNGCGVVAASFGMDPAFNFASSCGTSPNTSGINAATDVSSTGNWISLNAG